MNSFLEDHQREMSGVENAGGNDEEDKDTYHFSQTVSAMEIAK